MDSSETCTGLNDLIQSADQVTCSDVEATTPHHDDVIGHLPNNQSAYGDRAHCDDVTSGEKQDAGGRRVYPLYCVVCHVTLNGGGQAREHFEGRTHARRLRLTSSAKQPVSNRMM